MSKHFEFRKPKKRLGEVGEIGYYFKDEFLSRYKTEAIQILRKRIEDAGSKTGDKTRTNFEKGREVLPDVWAVIHEEFKKSNERTKRIEEKKRPFYNQLNQRALQKKAEKLAEKIAYLESTKEERLREINEKIESLQKEIEQINQNLNKNAKS